MPQHILEELCESFSLQAFHKDEEKSQVFFEVLRKVDFSLKIRPIFMKI
jgi:hypothetical protein